MGKFADRRTVVQVAARVARAQANGREKKYLSNAIATYNCDTTGSITDLCIIPQGNTVNTRNGKEISLKAVQVRGQVLAGTGSKERVCLMLVYDREPNAAAAVPVMTDILAAASSTALSNRDNAPRFKVIRRWEFNIVGTPGTASVSEQSQHIVDEYVRLGPKYQIKWQASDTTGATAAKIKGNLLLVVVGNNANSAATPTFVVNTRVDFQD